MIQWLHIHSQCSVRPELVAVSQSHRCCLSCSDPFQSPIPAKLQCIDLLYLTCQRGWVCTSFLRMRCHALFDTMTASFISQRTVMCRTRKLNCLHWLLAMYPITEKSCLIENSEIALLKYFWFWKTIHCLLTCELMCQFFHSAEFFHRYHGIYCLYFTNLLAENNQT